MKFVAAVAAVAGALALSSPALAHHATAAQYDVSTMVTLKGVISRIDWTNPHIRVYVDVKPESGGSEIWTLEFPSPGAIIVAGLSRQSLAPGTRLVIEAFPAKPAADPSKTPRTACAKAITLSDGSRFAFVVGI